MLASKARRNHLERPPPPLYNQQRAVLRSWLPSVRAERQRHVLSSEMPVEQVLAACTQLTAPSAAECCPMGIFASNAPDVSQFAGCAVHSNATGRALILSLRMASTEAPDLIATDPGHLLTCCLRLLSANDLGDNPHKCLPWSTCHAYRMLTLSSCFPTRRARIARGRSADVR